MNQYGVFAVNYTKYDSGVLKRKPNVLLDFRGAESILSPNQASHTENPSQKAHFKGIVLTTKEQLYLEHIYIIAPSKNMAF